MIQVFLKNGECVEVQAASSADIKAGRVICFDENGTEITSFLVEAVETYTADEQLAQVISEEVCEETTVIPEDLAERH